MIRTKSGAAWLSVVSNSLLIALKLAAGAITGSIAIITEALHSAIDLMASVIALISVRRADEPADEDHPYGHEQVENLAAAIEGMLILVGAGVIIYEATRRLVTGSEIESLGVGIAVIGFSVVANLVVSSVLYARARQHGSAALEGDAAHLRADALTSFGVLVGLAPRRDHRRARLRRDRRARRRRRDRLVRDPDPHPLLAGARRRGAAGRGARPDRGGDRQRPAAGDGRLPQAPRAAGPAPPSTSTCTSSSAPAPRSSEPTSSPTRCATRSSARPPPTTS